MLRVERRNARVRAATEKERHKQESGDYFLHTRAFKVPREFTDIEFERGDGKPIKAHKGDHPTHIYLQLTRSCRVADY